MSEGIEAGTVLDGRYRLDFPIGEGGMGTVWRGHHLELDAEVAIKLVRGVTSDKAQVRFKREARAAAKLRSQNVVQVLDHGVADGVPYIVMELLAGESLKDRLDDKGKLAPAELEAIFSQMARAVDRAHEIGIVHRDLKPGNVHLVPEEGGEVVKILDFGVAKMTDSLDDANTQTGALMGTPYYMSPEQLSDSKNVEPAADRWALAVIAYEALLGARPFSGNTVGAVAMKLAGTPPVPSEHGAVPVGFDAWFQKATAREVEDRFASAKAMAEALREALATKVADEALEATVTTALDGGSSELAEARSAITKSMPKSEREDAAAPIAPAAPATSGDRWRTWGWPLAVLVVGGGTYLATRQPAVPPSTTVGGTRSVTSQHVVSSAAPADTMTSSAPPVPSWSAFPCAELTEPNKEASCKTDYVAWCDHAGKQVACCGKGLTPVDAGGACGCPPGGTTHEAAQKQGCKASTGLDPEKFQKMVRSRWQAIKDCYEAALKRNDKLAGRIHVTLRLDAHGQVWDLRLGESALPDPEAQRCMLEVWRALPFEPPPNGNITVGYPLVFSNE